VQVVYQARVSLAQPDFTAECLQARNNGAVAVAVMADVNTVIRVAQSCDRQSYHPRLLLTLGSDGLAEVPELDGSLITMRSFPWFLYSGSPALDEYGAAVRQYAPDREGESADFATLGWVAGKLVEAAGQGLPEPATGRDLLDGLWSLQGETLGGLVPPLTFVRDQPTQELFCAWQGTLTHGEWQAPQGVQPVCR
jgi:branched-chain amino acid transport system substrate-binding protein